MDDYGKIRVLYFNEWLAGSWQVQKIHAVEFVNAFSKRCDVLVFPEINEHHFSKTSTWQHKKIDMKTNIRSRLPVFSKSLVHKVYCLNRDNKLKKRIRRYKPDLVIARHDRNCLSALSGLAEGKTPLILEVNGLITHDLELANKKITPKTYKKENELLQAADALFTVSATLSGMIREMGIDSRKVFTVPNGVDPNKFMPRPKSSTLISTYRLADHIVIGYVGGFDADEGDGRDVLGMLKAFKLAKENCSHPMKMLIIGRIAGQMLNNQIEGMGLTDSVVITGFISHPHVSRFISLIDIAVAPYFTKHIKFRSPVKVFEYMAMEKPVVVPGVGQPAEFLTDGRSAMFAEPESPESMANAFKKLIDDAALRRKIGRNARKLILDKYTWDESARKVFSIARSVLEDQKERS